MGLRSLLRRVSPEFRGCFPFQGGKTFCASLIAGSGREFSVCCLCLFFAVVLSEIHEVRKFGTCKAFSFDMFAFFRRLKITGFSSGFRTTNVKGKTDHSVSLRWNKRF